jgi:hypothetical protein
VSTTVGGGGGSGLSGSSGVVGGSVGVTGGSVVGSFVGSEVGSVGGRGGVLVAGGIGGSERSAVVGDGLPGNVGSVVGAVVGLSTGWTVEGLMVGGNGVITAEVVGTGTEVGVFQGIGGKNLLGSGPGCWPATGPVASAPPPPGSGISGAPILGPPSRLMSTSTAYSPVGAIRTAIRRNPSRCSQGLRRLAGSSSENGFTSPGG